MSMFGRRTLASAGIASPTLFYDTFTGVNGTLLPAHTPDTDASGNGWTTQAGTPDIFDNQARITATEIATVDCGVADCVISANVKCLGLAAVAGIIVRFSSASSYTFVTIEDFFDRFRVYEWNGSTLTSRASTNVTIDIGTEYTMTITLSGTSITATLDGANSINYTSSLNVSSTIHGISSRNNTGNFDDFTLLTG